MNDRIPRSERGHVLVDVKAQPSGWPAASLDPDSGRGPMARSGTPTKKIHKFRSLRIQGIATCPSLADKTITPHVLRHTRAMRMRAAGHDISMIALWLGHEDISSTQKYLHADLMTKERALDRTTSDDVPPGRYQPADTMLNFLDTLMAST